MKTGWMKQNAPNPVKSETTVQYFLTGDAGEAKILLTDMKGRFLQSWNLVKGNGTIRIAGIQYPNGTYNYSLIIDGVTVATKKIIVAK